jgi:hypothetical protein
MKVPKWLEGLLWAMAGGAAFPLIEIQEYLTKWKEFDIDWTHVGKLAIAGAVAAGLLWLRDQAKRREAAELALQIVSQAGTPGAGVAMKSPDAV